MFKNARLKILALGFLWIFSAGSLAQEDASKEESLSSDGMVEVEPSYVEFQRTESRFQLVPYRERRGKWGNQVSVGYSMYTPSSYASEYSALAFEDAYGNQSELPLIEVQYVFKRNFPVMSIGFEVGAGIYENESDVETLVTKLRLIPIHFGAVLTLDGIFKSPYVVPYASAGGYVMVFEESKDGAADVYGGSTQVAPYATGGMLINMDWMDPQASRTGFEDNGIQATFFYVEARKYFASAAARDRDFENEIEPKAGLRIEF